WRSSERLPPPRNQQALFVGLNDAWIWCFPLGPDLRSVGLVELEDAPRRDYDATVRASTVGELLGANAERISPLRHARDWSYRCEHVAGPGWFAIGDAAGFIDPILSTGVLLAMHSGLAAANACAAIASGGSEADEKTSYADAHRSMFDDMLRIVRFYYEQNGDRDALFWESKRLLSGRVELKPQKAFMMLTSGLIGNLALEAARGEAPRSADDFVCVHLEERRGAEVAQLYWLIEGRSDEPALFQTRSFNLTCLAPRYNNDPIRLPELRAPLEALRGAIDDSDTGFESLTAWWSRGGREALRSALERLPPELRVRRVFGQ
ncbi:MAG: tryptophan 7-halogenase, partial [Myxococcota bacterium]